MMTTTKAWFKAGLPLLLLVCAAAAPPRELALADAPLPVQQAVRAQPDLSGSKVDVLEVEERDLNHDGHPEWLVVADVTDVAGMHPVNRPMWLFRQEGKTWRLVDYLGEQLKVEAQQRAGTWDDLRVTAKEGPRQRCAVLGWAKDHYQKKGCCDPGRGTVVPCPKE